ncbi:dimethylmenaquinone methyltransferase [Jiangella asiatica]|uniref:Putative 4-hydroxy-4-methyl-2-oxoglutarate aldolase n=1 Tax=Jiangella asiatica TaxID=2530372 RepID=A0A4R5D6X9_9ACTN|nr:dimethylmenaquinone methyltransferase [Jiangella asiatica]TDE07431.1 dimethylmenaquinone methyltransferase [Jiangella asiatica]
MPSCRLYPTADPALRPALVERGRALPTSVLSDQLERFGAVRGLLPLLGRAPDTRLAGPALTVRTRPGDNLAVHLAIDLAEPGDVLVVDAGAFVDRAVMGEIVYRHAVARGIAGVVVDGAVRDGADIARGPVPVFCRGVTHLGPSRHGPGEVRGPVAVGGAVVQAGDLVVGDADGLVVVPRERADEVVGAGEAAFAGEADQLAAADRGALDRSWLGAVEVVEVDRARG